MVDDKLEDESGERSGAYIDFEPSDEPIVKETARKVRRIGYAVAVVFLVWMNAPIIIDVISGALSGEARDPYSQRIVGADQRVDDCKKWAFELLDAKSAGGDEVTSWRERCSDRYPALANRLE